MIRLSRTLVGALVAVCCTFVDAAPRAVRIGVTAGEESQIMSQVRDVAAKQGLRLDIVVFENPSHIDAALAGGSIDAASFEDEASLDARRRRDGYAIRSVAATVTLPMAFYSRKLASLAQLTRGATIAIPDDAPGMARALILLQNYAFVTLKDSAGLSPTVADITSNRYGLLIRRVPRARLYAMLDTASFVAMNADDAAHAGLMPGRDSIGIEDARSPWQHVLTVRSGEANAPWVAQLVRAYHSGDVARFILARYQDSVRRPW